MKKLDNILLLLFLCSNVIAKGKLKLLSNISLLFNKYKAYFSVKSDDHRKLFFVDSTTLKVGEFNFPGLLSQPAKNALMKLVFKNEEYFPNFFLVTGKNMISMKDKLVNVHFSDFGTHSVLNFSR